MNLLSYSPIAGANQPGFTSPSFTLAQDVSPKAGARQFFVSAVSGLPGVAVHSTEKPFTITMEQPRVQSVLSVAQLTGTGYYLRVKKNKYCMRVRKALEFSSTTGQQEIFQLPFWFELPSAGASRDPASVKAAFSLIVGTLVEIAPDFITAMTSGAWIE